MMSKRMTANRLATLDYMYSNRKKLPEGAVFELLDALQAERDKVNELEITLARLTSNSE